MPAGVTFTGKYNMRMRLYQSSGDGSSPSGYGGVGEVEDHQLNVAQLAVNLAAFEASCQNDQLWVTWTTISEIDNLGFNRPPT